MKNNILLLFIAMLFISACDRKEDYKQINSSTLEASGEYYVRYDHESFGEDPFGTGFTKILISNTAADNGVEVWLTDEGHFWDYKVKIPVNLETMTFGSENIVMNEVDGYDIDVIVKNGKIIKDVVKLPSGVNADSIYFEIWFDDLEDATGIANDKLLVGGHRKSGYLEDEP